MNKEKYLLEKGLRRNYERNEAFKDVDKLRETVTWFCCHFPSSSKGS